MPLSCSIYSASVFEDSGITLMARIVGNDGTYINQADFGSINYVVTDENNNEITAVTTLTVADVVFDALVTAATDPRWPHASPDVGYNFLFTVAATSFPTGGVTNSVEVKFAPTAGQPFHVVWDVEVLNLRRS